MMELRDKIEQAVRDYRNHHPARTADVIVNLIGRYRESMDIIEPNDKTPPLDHTTSAS